MKVLLGTKIYILYWQNHVKSGCVIAEFHCTNRINLATSWLCHKRSDVSFVLWYIFQVLSVQRTTNVGTEGALAIDVFGSPMIKKSLQPPLPHALKRAEPWLPSTPSKYSILWNPCCLKTNGFGSEVIVKNARKQMRTSGFGHPEMSCLSGAHCGINMGASSALGMARKYTVLCGFLRSVSRLATPLGNSTIVFCVERGQPFKELQNRGN